MEGHGNRTRPWDAPAQVRRGRARGRSIARVVPALDDDRRGAADGTGAGRTHAAPHRLVRDRRRGACPAAGARVPPAPPGERALGRQTCVSVGLSLTQRTLAGRAGGTRAPSRRARAATSIADESVRRRMRSAAPVPSAAPRRSSSSAGNDTRNRSPTSTASTYLRRRVPRTSSISMTLHLYRVRTRRNGLRECSAKLREAGPIKNTDVEIGRKFSLTLARRGRSVRHYRFADASDSELVYERGTRLRAGRDVRRLRERAIGKPVGWRLRGHAGWLGAGARAPRRSRAANAARLLGAFPRSREPASVTQLCTVRACATRCSAISIRSSTTRSPPTRLRLRSSPRPARAKTRVLTRRIAYGTREGRIVARHVLAVTFTRKAAGELVSRIGRLGSTPHHRRHVPRDRPRAAAAPCHRAQSRGAARARSQGRLLGPIVAEAGRPPWRWQMSRPRSSGRKRASSRPTAMKPRPTQPGVARQRGGWDLAVVRGVRNGKAPPAPDRLRRRARSVRRCDRAGRGVRGRTALALPPPVRRRVPGRHPVATTTPAGLVGRLERADGGRRPGPGDLRLHRRRRRAAFSRSTKPFGKQDDRAHPQLPEHTGRRGARRGRARAERVVEFPSPPRRPYDPTGPRRRSGATTTTTPRRVRSPRRARRPTRTECRGTAWPSCSAPTPSRHASRRRSPSAVCPSGSARGSASRPDRSWRPSRPPSQLGAEASRPPVGALPRRSRRRRQDDRVRRDTGASRRAARSRARLRRDGRGVGGVAEFATWLDTATGGSAAAPGSGGDTGSTWSRSTAPRASNGASCSSPASSGVWCRSRGRSPTRR